MKKVIAITQNITENNSYKEVRETLDVNFINFIQDLGFIPLILSSRINIEEYFSLFKIDGLILSGGNDLSCCNDNICSNERDIFEKKLIEYCIEYDIPILGICRGMQIIADYFGSTFEKVDNQVAIKHSLKIESSSKYFNELSQLIEVNSFHNYAIKNLSNSLRISVKSDCNLIKAIEHTKYKIFAHMWHPERNNPFNRNELKLIKEFFTKEDI